MTEKKEASRTLNILSQRDVADLLGLSISSVQRLRRARASGGARAFPPRKSFGGIKGWLYRDLVSWLESAPVDEGDKEEEDCGGRAAKEGRG